eukprot:7373701-Ditylum_brightwellii.AAC.1
MRMLEQGLQHHHTANHSVRMTKHNGKKQRQMRRMLKSLQSISPKSLTTLIHSPVMHQSYLWSPPNPNSPN